MAGDESLKAQDILVPSTLPGGAKLPLESSTPKLPQNPHTGDFPGGAVVGSPPASAGDTGSGPGPGGFPHAAEQPSP